MVSLCEERSDAAIKDYMDCHAPLAMTTFFHASRRETTRRMVATAK
jgi:hypothetical protein